MLRSAVYLQIPPDGRAFSLSVSECDMGKDTQQQGIICAAVKALLKY